MEPGHPADASAQDAEGVPALEVALAALLCFLPTVVSGYVYDDLMLVRDNEHAHGLGDLARAFTTHFWAIGAAGRGALPYYRPLVTVTYILNWVMAGGRPWLFHFFNAALHAATTYLVVRVVKRWTGRPLLAVAVAAVFALHPSRTESVEWIAGRTDVLMTFFLLVSVEVTYAGALSTVARERTLTRAGSLLSFALALLSKESAVVLPLLLMVDLLASTDAGRRRALGASVIWHAVVAAAYLALRKWLLPFGVTNALELTPRYGLLTVFAYAERVVLPWPQTFFHRPLTFEGGAFVYPASLVAGGAVLLVLYASLTLATYRRDRASALLLVTAAAALGPLLNFTHTGIFVTTSDHFLYLPLLLLLAGLARRYRDALSEWARSRSVRVAFACLLLSYLAVDTLRVLDYQDQESLYRHEVRLNPQNPQALRALSEVNAHAGRIEEAFDLLRRGSLPESTRYALLLPPYRLYENYLRMLGLSAAMTADGNVRDLALLYRELDALLAGRLATVSGRVGDLELGRPVAPELHAYTLGYGTRDILAAEAGFLATRLGDDAHARDLLGSISEAHLDVLPSVQNVALAYARLEDFASARRWLDAPARASPDRHSPEGAAPERRRFDAAEAHFAQAMGATGVERRRLRAEAFLDLGAYLRALRELRPAYERDPTNSVVGPLYLHLLVVAGLDEEALAVATRALGPEEGRALVERTRAGMSARLMSLRRPVEPSAWFVPEARLE